MAEPADPSELLALQLMQQHWEELKAEQDDRPDEEMNDFKLALQMQLLSVVNHFQSLEDRRYCHQVYPQPDTEQLDPITATAAEQSEDASYWAPDTAAPRTVVGTLRIADSESSEASERGTADSSAAAADGPDLACAACHEVQDEKLATRVPCGHAYCPDCLTSLFEGATTDESLFPPRCCRQPIPLDAAKSWLPRGLITEFERKQLEFTTANRTYCSNTKCSLFIPPKDIASDRAHCQSCNEWTCTICKSAQHNDMCPDDPSKAEFVALKEENAWQQCFGCKNLVGLTSGCNHVTCRCGKQFCYECGDEWRTCSCEQWEERRIILRGNE
ncbi:IBR finger domain protein [Cordyceps militaris CM01]|uniref:RBR-type E3 ubiquitin transferase n=1 Tax=Cordyceps militaris (strain CM01) TaxID=983644 RepID=G3J4B7_CORMM|nr:IBR finger domain protein [Cordyceps militaris CM01]EGX95839.1 IBR finger domain protein [Cordyceps militaris CM01]